MQSSNPLQETYNILKEFDLEAEDVTNEQEKVVCNKETPIKARIVGGWG